MNHPGGMFLANAGGSVQQNRDIGGTRQFDLLQDPIHASGLPQQRSDAKAASQGIT